MSFEPSTKPIALTMGEPAGIGGEVSLKAWLALRETGPAFVAFDSPSRLSTLAARLDLDIPIREISSISDAADVFKDALPISPIALPVISQAGFPDIRNASATIASIDTAVTATRAGLTSAVVTNPIHKKTLYRAGFVHPGHTEYLATLAGVPRVAMMLACSEVRTIPVTIHRSLTSAIAALRTEKIVEIGILVAAELRTRFGLQHPRLAVAGLNPHAGEGGTMGDEEEKIIRPAVELLRSSGIAVEGPLPPDTMFTARARMRYDAAICMYHDQALIPVKTLDVDGGVNVTLGLPFIRTSPDHGTALDIAGRGIADCSSLIAALRLASQLAHASERE